MQIAIPCVMMRAGTSRGPFLLASDLPTEPTSRDAVLLALMGSPHPLQIDGIGGGDTLTSKVAIVGPSDSPDADIDYLFAQVAVDRGLVDTRPNCGNMLAGVGPFALEAGLVPATGPVSTVRIRNRNTGALVEARIRTPGGCVTYEGDVAIPGVPGTAAPIELRFRRIAGALTGALLPSGATLERIGGFETTLVDCAMPVMLLDGAAFAPDAAGFDARFVAEAALRDAIETARREAGLRMGLGEVGESVVPKVALLWRGEADTHLVARYLTPRSIHRALAVTGGMAIAAAARLPGTLAVRIGQPSEGMVRIAHPSGRLEIDLGMEDGTVAWAGVVRTARRLFAGEAYVPASAWLGAQAAYVAAE